MIARVWRGWTRPEEAEAYERLLRDEILPGIVEDAPACRGGDVLRHRTETEVEFMTILWFDSMDGIRAFVGAPPEAAHVPPRARELLHRYEEEVRHYRHRGDRAGPPGSVPAEGPEGPG